jgi:hypothetical protein
MQVTVLAWTTAQPFGPDLSLLANEEQQRPYLRYGEHSLPVLWVHHHPVFEPVTQGLGHCLKGESPHLEY